MSGQGYRFSIINAKRNQKGYFNGKKGKWRKTALLNEDDTGVLQQIVEGATNKNVKVEYDSTNNNLHFDIDVDGTPMAISGEETGGQILRMMVQLSLLRAGGRTFDTNKVLQVNGPKKACMLYVQMVLYLLKIGDSFSFIGGDPENNKAPNPDYWKTVFDIIRDMTGRSFQLDRDGDKFTIKRLQNVTPKTNWKQTDEVLDIHLTDQILMAIFFTADAVTEENDTRGIPLKFKKNKWDFHIPAMIREAYEQELNGEVRKIPSGILRQFGFRIETIAEDDTTQTITVRPPLVGSDLRGF